MPVDIAKLTNLSQGIQAKMTNRPTPGKWYDIRNAASDTAEVYLYGGIGGWFGTSASDFVAELSALRSSNIELHVNSEGGEIFDGVAIFTALVNHPATVTCIIDGLAASAASFIAMAADTVIMSKHTRMMIHDASGFCMGNAADMRELADLLDGLSNTIAEVYADRAGEDVAFWRGAMTAETWYTAEQAVAVGLADSVAGTERTAPVDSVKPISAPPVPSDTPIFDSVPLPVEFDTRAFRMALLASQLTR